MNNWARTGVSGLLLSSAATFAATAAVASLVVGLPVAAAVGIAAGGVCGVKHVCAHHAPMLVRVDVVAEGFVAGCTGHNVVATGSAEACRAVTVERLALGEEAVGPVAEYGRGVRKWYMECILHFGRLDDTPADRQVLHKWLGGQMKAADVRITDAVSWIPIIVELYYLPTVGELFAGRLKASAAYAVVKAAAQPAARR